MRKYLFAILLFIISLFFINNAFALDSSYDIANYQVFSYTSPSGGTRVTDGYTNSLNVSRTLNGNYLESMYIQVYGNNNIIYKAGNTYTFDFKVNFNPKMWNYLDNTYTTSNIEVYGNDTASSTGASMNNITSSSLTITNVNGDNYQMHYVYKIVPDIDLKYVLFKCLYPYSLLASNLEYPYSLISLNVVSLDISYQQGIGSVIDDQTIVIQNGINNVINNINNTTQSIINNQNQNTQQHIESQKVCNLIDSSNIYTFGYYLYPDGHLTSDTSFGITDYISIENATITLIESRTGFASVCFYNVNKSLIRCFENGSLISGSTLQIPNNSSYFRASINISQNKPQFNICKNGNQALSDNINDLNNSINNDNISGGSGQADSFFNNFTTDTFGLTSIITSPLNLINSLTSKTCSPLTLQIPYINQNMELPCMSTVYQQYFGTFFSIYQTITFGVVSYWVCVRIFALVKDFKNPDHDEIEVMDL